jgi:hypothetical protein
VAFTSPNDPGLPFFPEGADEPFLEHLLARLGKSCLFLDIRSAPQDHWLRAPVPARILGGPAVAPWAEIFDGIVYVDPLK